MTDYPDIEELKIVEGALEEDAPETVDSEDERPLIDRWAEWADIIDR